WSLPVFQMFHTLGRLKNGVARERAEWEPQVRIAEEARIVAEADGLVAANTVERADLVRHYGASADRITVVPCGVDTTLFTPMLQAEARALLDLDIGPLLLYVGRLARRRPHDDRPRWVDRLPRAGGRSRCAGRADRPRALRSRPARGDGARGCAVGCRAPLAVRGRSDLPGLRQPGSRCPAPPRRCQVPLTPSSL